MSISSEFALNALNASLLAAKDASELIDMGIQGGHTDTVSEGLDIMTGAVSDTAEIIERMGFPSGLGAPPRRGMGPWLPEAMIDALRTANAVDDVAVEALLRTHGNLPLEDESLLMQEIFRLIRIMKVRTHEVRRRIQEQWPGFWGIEHDALFGKYLRKGPPK